MRWPWVSRRRFDAIYACLVEAQRRDEWTYGACLDYKRAAEIERAGRLRACDQIRFKDALIRRALAVLGRTGEEIASNLGNVKT